MSCEEEEKRFVKRDGVGGQVLATRISWGIWTSNARFFFSFFLFLFLCLLVCVSTVVCLVSWVACLCCLRPCFLIITCILWLHLSPLFLSRTHTLTSSCVSALFLCVSTTNTNSVIVSSFFATSLYRLLSLASFDTFHIPLM